ncbi:hypothetical protein Ahy_B10g104964 [Arachis hypogaea]|uniref:Pentatricopeptide repeat-containing protein n=1 Tax=Arachis hypogaea TaxID=3818 RepID=A0A444X6V5_ARAHY|nr:hypothetical protein Ahy_B10g104964 [Arachis hypogaea]
MFKRDIVPDIECYQILMQAMCRKSQVNGAVNLLEDMLNKGNKIKGYNPDVVHYNTVISGFYRKGSTHDARKFIANMQNNECLPNVVLYRSLVGRLCNKRMLDEANNYMKEMLSKSFSLHFAFIHSLVKGFCNVGKIEETCGVLTKLLEHGKAPHMVDDGVRSKDVLEQVLRIEITCHTRIVDADIAYSFPIGPSSRKKKKSSNVPFTIPTFTILTLPTSFSSSNWAAQGNSHLSMTLLDASNPNPTQSLLPCSPMIRVYGETDLPEKALKITYTMLQYGFKPLPKYLNRILEILVSHYNFVRLAFDLFRNAHRHGVSPNLSPTIFSCRLSV